MRFRFRTLHPFRLQISRLPSEQALKAHLLKGHKVYTSIWSTVRYLKKSNTTLTIDEILVEKITLCPSRLWTLHNMHQLCSRNLHLKRSSSNDKLCT